MKFQKTMTVTVLFVGACLLSGCATIVGDSAQSVQVNSVPPGAKFIVKDNAGVVVSRGTTPQSVLLQKSDGSYFGKREYNITLCKEGYKPETLSVNSSANGWYMGGNIVFGGLIGWLGVDPFNGGMYTLHPKETNAQLMSSSQGASGSNCEGVI
ncbi:hypothetical protein [Leclercia adecarboxylata]|nr:hypothetical protein [Leclercia adecarboxylata]